MLNYQLKLSWLKLERVVSAEHSITSTGNFSCHGRQLSPGLARQGLLHAGSSGNLPRPGRRHCSEGTRTPVSQAGDHPAVSQ